MKDQTELNFIGKCCDSCGNAPGNLIEVGTNFLCQPCLSANYFQCYCCRTWEPIASKDRRNGKYAVRDTGGYGKIVCRSCFEKNYVKCDHCGYGHQKVDIRFYEDKSYCRYCYDDMFVCVGCRRRMFRDHYYDAGLCQPCYEEERRIINPNHEAKVPMEFRGKGPHFYGVELEVAVDESLDRRANYARKVLKLLGDFIIIKHDGSIVDRNGRVNGFEIATIPAAREVHFERWNTFFDNLPKGLKSYDTPNCGLHIHCSRKPLTQLTIAKMLLFVNSKENAKFITIIAGRGSNRFCKIQNKIPGDVRRARDRYEALNLTNKGTVEFRIFRGTLKRESLFKSLEFCDALLHFCKECGYSISDTRRVDKFLEYVKLHKKEYIHLWAFLTARWYGIENDLTKKMGFPLPDKPAEVEIYNNEPNPEVHQQIVEPMIFVDDADVFDDNFIDINAGPIIR